MKAKVVHVWLGSVSLGERKSCPNCKTKLDKTNSVVSVGEYIYGKYRSYYYACRECLADVVEGLVDTRAFEYKVRCGHRVDWLDTVKTEQA